MKAALTTDAGCDGPNSARENAVLHKMPYY